MNPRVLPRRVGAALCAAVAAATAAPAAAMRDPFEPPAAPRAAQATEAAVPETPAVRHIVRVGDRPYVLDGARRYGVGDRFGGARIECFVDAGVVVRDATGLRLLPMFGGIVKRTGGDASTAASALCSRTARGEAK